MCMLAIVVPCFNEAEVLPSSLVQLAATRKQLVDEGLITPESTITFVDDGSTDGTWQLIEQWGARDASVHRIKLTRNQGHQNALIAGLLSVEGDAIVSIDADLQDDVATIRDMVLKFRAGAQIVYGVRGDRGSDSAFKRGSAEGYYRLLRMLGVDVVFNHADYRLMGRAAIDALRQFPEANLFLRGIVPMLGFPSGEVTYRRRERRAGKTKYALGRMLSLSWDGVTSFTTRPLRWITIGGFIVSAFSFAIGCWAVSVRIFFDAAVPGWASTVVPMYFLGGVQLISLGVLGEYVAKLYIESKRRPRYIVEKTV
jgi:glycosyltransferase involved in cell wall biosynthesis